MQLSTIRAESRRLLNIQDTGSALITTAGLTAWANIWQRDLAAFLEYPKTSEDITTVEGIRTYSLASDFMLIENVYFNVGGVSFKLLTPVDRRDLPTIFGPGWLSSANGEPRVVYMNDSTVIGLHPVPDAISAGTDYIKSFYIAVPAAMSADDDVPDLPESLHDTAPFFVAAMASIKLKQLGRYDKLISEYRRKRVVLRSATTSKMKGLRGFRWGAGIQGSD